MDVTYVRKCCRCGVIKPIESFQECFYNYRTRACNDCIALEDRGLPRALVLTEQGRQALREMAA